MVGEKVVGGGDVENSFGCSQKVMDHGKSDIGFCQRPFDDVDRLRPVAAENIAGENQPEQSPGNADQDYDHGFKHGRDPSCRQFQHPDEQDKGDHAQSGCTFEFAKKWGKIFSIHRSSSTWNNRWV